MGQTNAKKRKVAILGFTDHRAIAFDLPHDEWEVWGLNELYRYEPIEKFDRWFEIHDRAILDPDKRHIEDLGKITTVPIYMQDHYDDIPNSRPLPKGQIERALGDFGVYQTSSIRWMLAMALLEGFKEIGVFGVDMAQESEYAEQRNCVEWLLGVAVGRGVKIHIPPNSDLLKSIGQYGYGFEGKGFMLKLQDRMTWLKKEELGYVDAIKSLDAQYKDKRGGLDAQYEQKKAELTLSLNHVQGAGQDCSYWKRSWAVPQASDTKSGPTPDRSKDEKTGLTKETVQAVGQPS